MWRGEIFVEGCSRAALSKRSACSQQAPRLNCEGSVLLVFDGTCVQSFINKRQHHVICADAVRDHRPDPRADIGELTAQQPHRTIWGCSPHDMLCIGGSRSGGGAGIIKSASCGSEAAVENANERPRQGR